MDGMYNRGFFECEDDECGFVFSLLGGQANFVPEVCPCCQSGIDYASTEARRKHFDELKSELSYINRGAL